MTEKLIRRLLSICCTLALIVGMSFITSNEAQAQEKQEPIIIDGSYLTHDSESVGYDTKLTRGVYLMAGYSKIVEMGAGRIYVGGTTIATQVVDEVGLAVVVERAQEGDTEWTSVGGWVLFEENTDRISSNRAMEVEGGYYYRVRCTHSANTDMSSSFSNGVYIE